jgi:hypothetical protein
LSGGKSGESAATIFAFLRGAVIVYDPGFRKRKPAQSFGESRADCGAAAGSLFEFATPEIRLRFRLRN